MQRRSLLLAAGAATLPLTGRLAWAQTGGAVAGSGSRVPRAVYRKWTELAAASGIKVTYEEIGGGPSLERLKARATDFASVDYPRRSALLREHQLIQFPTVITPTVPFVNLPGVADGRLRLTGELLADIYLGKITKWNDARVKAENEGLDLPAAAIVPVQRSDASGVTFLLTTYLTRQSETWAAGPRAGTSVQWPANVGTAVDGLDAMAAKVKSTPGAIGFGNPALVRESGMPSVSLKNRAGEFVKAEIGSFTKAAEAVDWNVPAFNVDLVDTDAAGAWPITGANFALVPENPAAEKVEAARNTFKFFDWAFKNGRAVASELGFAGIPESGRNRIYEVWRRAKDPSGRPIWEA